MSTAFWNTLSRLSDILGVGSGLAMIVGWGLKFAQKPQWSSMLLRYMPWFTFFIGVALARLFWPLTFGPVEVDLTRPSSSAGTAEIRVQNIQFIPPHIFELKGTYKDIPNNQTLFAYVRSTEGKIHLKEIGVNPDGTWTTLPRDPFAMGSADKLGGRYEAGLILAEQPDCINMAASKDSLDQLPDCVNYVQVVNITRHT